MDNIEKMRYLMEALDFGDEDEQDSTDTDSTDDSVDDESTELSSSDDNQDDAQNDSAAASLNSIMNSLKIITSNISDSSKAEEINAGLQQIASSLQELSDSVGSIEEQSGTEGMAPKMCDDDGSMMQVYNDPDGDSYAARNGFVG